MDTPKSEKALENSEFRNVFDLEVLSGKVMGLGALGQKGVEIALDILDAELIRDMRLAGTTSIEKITSDFVTRR